MIQSIFAEIARCFIDKGFVTQINKNPHLLEAKSVSSVVYIQIEQYVGDDYLISLLHEVAPNSCAWRASIDIFQLVMIELIYQHRSPAAKYFMRQNLPALKQIGIEKVVTGLVELHRQYEEICFDLQARRTPEKLAGLLQLFDSGKAGIQSSIYTVLNEHFPASESKVLSGSKPTRSALIGQIGKGVLSP